MSSFRHPLRLVWATLLALLLSACEATERSGAGTDRMERLDGNRVAETRARAKAVGGDEHLPGDVQAGGTVHAAPDFPQVDLPVTTAGYTGDETLWRQEVPRLRDVHIRSSVDGTEQPAWWLPPRGSGPQPLLVVFHSWSYGYEQHFGVPFARWADEAGWGMLHPNFRGRFNTPEATGSDLAVQDVIDAIDFASANAEIDPDHVYGIGFSGGGLMALLLAGRHPDRFAGVVAWVPMYDLTEWYLYSLHHGRRRYADEIMASCGGDPSTDRAAHRACQARSPRTHIHGAREAGVPIYIGSGLADQVVTPDRVLTQFNDLAQPADRLDDDVVSEAARNRLPAALHGAAAPGHFFAREDPRVVFARTSGPVTVVLFDGGHEMVFAPGLRWIWHLRHGTP